MRVAVQTLALATFCLVACSSPSPDEIFISEVHRVTGSQPRDVEVLVVLGDGTCMSCSKHLAQLLPRYTQEPALTIVNFTSTAVLDVSQFMESPGYVDGNTLEINEPDLRLRSRIILVRSGVVERSIEIRTQDMDRVEEQLAEVLKELSSVP
jgi:hypothetical protein